MSKITRGIISITLLSGLIITSLVVKDKVAAYDFEGNETYWTNYCSGVISDANKQAACNDYRNYISNKISDSSKNVNNITSSIDDVKADLSNLKEVSEQYENLIKTAESDIETINSSLTQMESSINVVEENIKEKKGKIKARKEIIKKRMVEMQPTINTNQFLQYIMGASDLVDLVQRSNSVESFTKNDKEQIAALNKEKKELENDKAEKKRIEETLIVQKENLDLKQKELTALQDANEKMVAEYEVKLAELEKQKNEASAAANTLAALSPQFSVSNGNADVDSITSSGWFRPIQGYAISRDINNEGHRGADFAAPKGTPIYAPADCYVVFASTGYGDGWLGNWAGVPAGGGNSVRIIFNINGQTYAMNFHHLQASSDAALSNNGTSNVVPQGTCLGWVGSSGNSSGPHAHVELFIINQSIQQAVATWYSTGDWQSGCGWGLYTPASSSYATRVSPVPYF